MQHPLVTAFRSTRSTLRRDAAMAAAIRYGGGDLEGLGFTAEEITKHEHEARILAARA